MSTDAPATRDEVLAALEHFTTPATVDRIVSVIKSRRGGQGAPAVPSHSVHLELAKLAPTGLVVHARRSRAKAKFGRVPAHTHRDTHLYALATNVALWKA